MDEMPVVLFENVSKRFAFRREAPQSILESLITFFSRQRRRKRDQDLWAVHNVSFAVKPGQAIGIIGRNGSGKSTILKLIARILRPTSGRVTIRGRTSALLELGAGFHLDLTGRENILLNGAVLGLDKDAIHQRFNDIVEFSELGEFIDMPVKHYSSGMYMRLGFSVAIHVDPDILIVDEILAVGDQAFQTKCIDRIYKMKNSGTTIIMVSHHLATMRKLCSYLIWVDNGRVRQSGLTEEIAQQYIAYAHEQQDRQLSQNGPFIRQGRGDIEITAVRFLDDEGQEKRTFRTGELMTVEMAYTAHRPIHDPEFGLAIYRQDGVHINGPNSQLAGLDMGSVSGSGLVRYTIERLPLLPARYQVTTAVHDSRLGTTYDFHEQAHAFRVVSGGTNEIYGLLDIPATWEWVVDEGNETVQAPVGQPNRA